MNQACEKVYKSQVVPSFKAKFDQVCDKLVDYLKNGTSSLTQGIYVQIDDYWFYVKMDQHTCALVLKVSNNIKHSPCLADVEYNMVLGRFVKNHNHHLVELLIKRLSVLCQTNKLPC